MPALEKLEQISGSAIGEEFDARNVVSPGSHAELYEFLQIKNGFYAFESALHVFPAKAVAPEIGLDDWNSPGLWRSSFGGMTDGCFFFAEDAFGIQFALREADVCTFDPETGIQETFARDLEGWASLILEDYNLHTGYPLAHAWQVVHGRIPIGKRLLPKMPFVAGGEFAVENLYAHDAIQGMLFRAEIAKQIKDLPDGAKIRFEIKD